MQHLMSPLDLSVEELDKLLTLANDIERNPQKYAHACEGKKLATCFYEPSTRTRLSFEAAMLNLGGSVLGFSTADSSSAAKGESVSDTIRVISCYADICAMRHPKEGAPLVASEKSTIPVINAGDGGHQHPTQTLTDLLTIRSLKGRLDNLTIGLCGDLKFGRTVHSLIHALIRYPNIQFVLISPEELRLPDYIREDVLVANGVPFEEMERLEQTGTTFRDKQKQDAKPVRYAGAVVMALLTTALMAALIVLMVWAFTVDPSDAPPLALLVVLVAIPGVIILGVLLALFQRIKEIQKGEEDDAKNY